MNITNKSRTGPLEGGRVAFNTSDPNCSRRGDEADKTIVPESFSPLPQFLFCNVSISIFSL